MKRYLFSRMFGIFLAGILLVESSIPVFATETVNETQQQVETVQEAENEEAAEIEIVDEKNEVAEPESSEVKASESKEPEESQVVKTTQGEESSEVTESTTIVMSTETIEASTEETIEEESFVEEEITDEKESTEETAEVITSEAVEEITEEETEEETETTTEEMTEELPKIMLFTANAQATAPTEAPSDVCVIERTATTATLLWKTIDGYTEYQVQRSSNASTGFSALEGATIETTSNIGAFLDTSCESGKIYYYRVCAVVTFDGEVVEQGPFSEVVNNSVALQQITLNESAIAMHKGDESVLSISYTPSFAAGMHSVTWSSDNSEVAIVKDGKITAVGAGTATITATAGGKTATCEVTVTVPLEQLVVSKEEVELIKGQSIAVLASFKPDDTTDEVTLKWRSSDDNVVTVVQDDENGKNAKITAVGAGSATITVSAGDVTAECKVNVIIPATAVQLSDNTIQLLEEEDSVNVTISITPMDTTDEVSYVVDDPELIDCEMGDRVLTIKSQGVLGTTQVHITVGNKTTVLNVQIVEEKQISDITSDIIPVSDITIEAEWNEKEDEEIVKGAINLWFGEDTYSKATVTATVTPANATNQQIEWSSSNKSVVTVDENGIVTAVGVGRASVIATADNGVTETVTVIVVPASGSFKITSGEKVTLYCNDELLSIDNASKTHQVLLSKEIICDYRSSNEAVATVDAKGLITAKGPGSAVISAVGKANGEVKTVQVTVKRIVESIEVLQEEITVIKGTKPEITFTALPKNTSVESLNTISVKTEKTNSDVITIDKNWTKGKTSGTIKFTADKVGDETIIITAGDTYYDAENEKIIVTSVRKEILVHVEDTPDMKAASVMVSGANKMKSASEQVLGVIVKDKSGNELNTSMITLGFASSNTEIATVDKDGKVTALKGGITVITVYALDGSNIKANYTINVEQRPEEIAFDRPVYGVSKATNATATIAVQPRFVPATTVNKTVTWSIEQVINADGTEVEGAVTDYFTVDASGRVTAKPAATDGMRAIVTCTSKAYDPDEEQVVGTVSVEVQAKKVTAVRFTKTTVEAVGLQEHSVPFTTTFVNGYSEALYEAYTSDEEIATVTEVKGGQVILKAHKYGTVTVTLCADRAVTATCKVTVYPVERGNLVAKDTTYLLQQAQYAGNDKVQLYFVDAKTKKTIVDPTLFSYQSSNPDIVYVDENGIAYANSVSNGKITTSNNQITITATLKDDPDKRKATTKVIVCPTEQIERMDVAYYETTSKANADTKNTKGTILTDNGTSMVYGGGSQSFVLRVTSFGADNETIKNPPLRFTSSDTTLATIASQSKKTITTDEEQYEFWEAVITVKQAGRFSIQVVAQDQKKYTRSINFAAYCAKPILVSKDLGTINRNAEVVVTNINENTAIEGIASNKEFTLLGGDGTEIKEVSVESAKVKLKASNKIETIPTGKFTVMKIGTNEYRLVMLANEVSKVVDGTYSITLNVKRTLLGNESATPDYGSNETATEKINTTFTIASTLPSLGAARITLNSFIKGEAVKIPINTTENIENVTIASGMLLATELDVFKQGKDWYAKIKDEAFDSWKKTSTSGVLYVQLEGYETPIAMNLYATFRETKPVVLQIEVPSIQLEHGASTYVTLVNAQRQVWEDYTVVRKSSTTAQIFDVENENANDDKTKVTFINPSMKLNGQGVTLTERVLVRKEEWRSPIEMSISVKAYNGNSMPTVSFVKPTVNINKTVGETEAETEVKVSHSNVVLAEGEWTISDTCKYLTVENGKSVWKSASEAFKVEYVDGVLKVSLRNEDVPNGTYRLTMTKIWDATLDEKLGKPLTTSALTVIVRQVNPVVNIGISGQLDLIKRSQSTLKGTITVANMNSTVKRVRLVNTNNDGFADKFYCTRRDNTFTIYARSSAVLTSTRITGNIEITMSDGNVLYKTISFTPMQSSPSVITPANETIYKSASVKTVDFNFNEKLTDGVRISDIKVTSLPAGLKVQDSNGHLFVTLGDKTLKQGTYKLVVNVYFKGAQAIAGDVQGRAVSRTIYVVVKE